MILIRTPARKGVAALVAINLLLAGCSDQKKFSGDPARVPNPYFGPMTVAVAPALNFSGSTEFDRDRVADLMASELGYANGINVIPVSRVLAVLAQQGRREIESPGHALEVCDRVGADAILVFAVTEYDPYDPPIVGLAAQLYGEVPWGGQGGGLDPVLVSRQARPFSVRAQDERGRGLLSQAQRVFDAEHDYVVEQVRQFAEHRSDDDSPYGWRAYLVSQERYLRCCCAMTIRTLMRPPQEAESPLVRVEGEEETR